MSVDFLLPDENALDALRQQLALRDGTPRETDIIYFDTFDGLLHDEGLVVAHENGELSLIERESGTVRARQAVPEPAAPLFAGDLQPGHLSDALQPLLHPRALLKIKKIHWREQPLDVLDDELKTVVRMKLVWPDGLGPRLHVAPVRGYDDELRDVLGRLDKGGFAAAGRPLLDEVGVTPLGPSSKIQVPLAFGQRADRAAVAVLSALLEVIEANMDGAINDLDSEFLHDLRVSVRRSRAVQRELKGVFPPGELAHFRAEFRWLQQVTGDARDLDVYLLGFERFRAMVPESMRGDLDQLFDVLRSRRQVAHAEMVQALCSHRCARLRSEWSRFLARLEAAPERDRPEAARPIGELAGKRTAKVYKRMVRMGNPLGAHSAPSDFHELRKKGKELRYLLELFGSQLYPGEVVGPMIKTLKALQDVLGRHQDREVQAAMVRSVSAEVREPRALMAMGALVQRLAEDEAQARREFADRFKAFASGSQRKLVKETFR